MGSAEKAEAGGQQSLSQADPTVSSRVELGQDASSCGRSLARHRWRKYAGVLPWNEELGYGTNQLWLSGETESEAWSESPEPTRDRGKSPVTGERVLRPRGCMNTEFSSGAEGPGAWCCKGPLYIWGQWRWGVTSPGLQGQPERVQVKPRLWGDWYGEWGVPPHCTPPGPVLTAVGVNFVCLSLPLLLLCSAQPSWLGAACLGHGSCWGKPSTDLTSRNWGSWPGASAIYPSTGGMQCQVTRYHAHPSSTSAIGWGRENCAMSRRSGYSGHDEGLTRFQAGMTKASQDSMPADVVFWWAEWAGLWAFCCAFFVSDTQM